MPSLNEKIADSLRNIIDLGKGEKRRVFKTNDISRTDRERLLDAGFLTEIIKGWVMTTRPGDRQGDSTAWYSSFWEFARTYLDERFGDDWTVSPEGSVLLHAENLNVPRQVIVHSPKANNQLVELPHDSSFYLLRVPKLTLAPVEISDVRVVPEAEALCQITPAFWHANKNDVVALLGAVRSAAILRALLAGRHSVVAGRVAGAYRQLGNNRAADEIVATMQRAGHDVREDPDPFKGPVPMQIAGARPVSPIATRIRLMWADMREAVLQNFDIEPRLINDHEAFMASIDDIYTSDAYHSLSIEGYTVTEDLVEKVRGGNWNPEDDPADREQKNALAAKGYWDAFQEVRKSVENILRGAAAPGEVVEMDHLEWYRALFRPSLAAGIVKPENLAGYRQHFIHIRGSRHTPANWESLPDAMDAYFDCLKAESDPRVRAVLGHFLFTFIHPLPDGNGRSGRFIMNAMLASGGMKWTIVPVDRRNEYMQALHDASNGNDIGPFARLIADCAKHEPPPPRRRRPGETLAEIDDEPSLPKP